MTKGHRTSPDVDPVGRVAHLVLYGEGDHGEGLPRGKRWIYDSGIHVPLVVRWPGRIKPGTSRDDLVCFLDFPPTVLSLAGVTPPAYMHGQVILGQHTARPRQYLFAHRDRMDEAIDLIRAVRDRRFKLAVYHGQEYGELYDLEEDPWEHVNLWESEAHRAVKSRLMRTAFDGLAFSVDLGPRRIGRY